MHNPVVAILYFWFPTLHIIVLQMKNAGVRGLGTSSHTENWQWYKQLYGPFQMESASVWMSSTLTSRSTDK